MLGFKVYYEKNTGKVVLTIPEDHHINALPSSKDEDFAMFTVLKARDKILIDFLELPYGKYRGDFSFANSWKVDVATKTVLFEYPQFEPAKTERVKELEASQRLQDDLLMELLMGAMA